MNQDFNFYITSMPKTRKADYYLGCLDSSVFLDFNLSTDKLISLIRISFDGYGCCNIGDKAGCLNLQDSQQFIEEIDKEVLNQESIGRLVKEIIKINKAHIWTDAIEEYGLIKEK